MGAVGARPGHPHAPPGSPSPFLALPASVVTASSSSARRRRRPRGCILPGEGGGGDGDGGDPVAHGPVVLSSSHPAPSTKERWGRGPWLPWCLAPAPKESRDGRNNPSKSIPLPRRGQGAEPAALTHKCRQCGSSPERFSRSAAPTAGSTTVSTSPVHQACAYVCACMCVCVCACTTAGRALPGSSTMG